jgi:Flp pilus assembly protein TadD
VESLRGIDLEPGALVGLRVLLAQAMRARGRLDDALPLLREAEAVREESLIFPRRQALAHLAGAIAETGDARAALRMANAALQVPAEDVRSRVVALRVLATCLEQCGDPAAARFAARQALALAGATEMTSELAATKAVLDRVTG